MIDYIQFIIGIIAFFFFVCTLLFAFRKGEDARVRFIVFLILTVTCCLIILAMNRL